MDKLTDIKANFSKYQAERDMLKGNLVDLNNKFEEINKAVASKQKAKEEILANVEALKNGVCNLRKHIENVSKYGVPAIVCINHFASDTENETAYLSKWCEDNGYDYAYCSAFADGGKGAEALAKGVMNILNNKKSNYHPLYDTNLPIKAKIETICKEIYGAGDVVYTEEANKQIEDYTALGFDKTPICIAKTPQSLTDDPKVLGAPKGFTVTIREVRLSAGANFIVPLTGAFGISLKLKLLS